MPLTQNTNVAGDIQERALAQFKGKPLLMGRLAAIASQFQDLENGFWSLVTGMPFPNAVGDALTKWGGVVGETRVAGTTDSAYRPLVQAKIYENVSNGRAEDALSIVRALGASYCLYINPGAATMLLQIQGTLACSDTDLENFLNDAMAPVTIHVSQWTSGPVFGFANSRVPNVAGFNAGKLARTVF